MGVFGRKYGSKLKDDKSDNQLNVSSSDSTPQTRNERKDKKTWKTFSSFRSSMKNKRRIESPRSVLADSVFDIGCVQADGDTSYEISFLSDNTMASPGRPETYYKGKTNGSSSIKLNRSASFGSFILNRTKSKPTRSQSTEAFDKKQNTDLFQDYYKHESQSWESNAEPKTEKVPVVSLRKKTQKDGEVFEDVSLDEPMSTKNNEQISQTTGDAVTEKAPVTKNDNNTQKDSSDINVVNTVLQVETDTPTSTSQTETAIKTEEQGPYFMDSIYCKPFAEFFACATSLDRFEKMLFGDDLIGECGNLQTACLPAECINSPNEINDKNDIVCTPVEQYSPVAPIVKQKSTELDDAIQVPHVPPGQDPTLILIDSFLSQTTQKGIPLTFYEPKDEDESEWDAHDITLYVTPGRRDQEISVPPKLMWVARNINGSAGQPTKNVYHHFDLGEINSVLKPDENLDEMEGADNDDMDQNCFSLITNESHVYIFEAANMKQRNYVVEALQLVVSRLAFV